MRKYTYGLVPIISVLAVAMVARPELASGQALAAATSGGAPTVSETLPMISFGTSSEWKAYADRLLNEAATLPAGGAETMRLVRTAATIQFRNGDEGPALDLIVHAAEEAARSGSVTLAAHAYLDGAWIATSMERQSEVNQLAERAVMLTISPLMSETDRLAILRRVERTIPAELAAR